MSCEKAALRKFYKEKAALLENKEALSQKIAARLFALDEFKNCSLLFAYYSLPSEVSTEPIIKRAKENSKPVALPRCAKSGNEMCFYLLQNENELEAVRFKGIFEPKTSLQKAVCDEESLLLVPAVAYGKNGSRLGKGMGFYDRFIASFKGKTVGLCFESCLDNALPETAFDKRVQIVITENETLFIK